MGDLKDDFMNEMGNDYRGDALFNEALSAHTSLGTGGPADIFVSPADAVSLKKCLLFARARKLPVLVMGGGTNIVVPDEGVRGMVVSLGHFSMIKTVNDTSDRAELFVEAGVPLQRLVNHCVQNGYGGIESLAGIPGTVGGAIRGNSGSFGQEIKDVIESLVVMNASGMIRRVEKGELTFDYRRSSLKEDEIVLSANMIFRREEAENLRRKSSEAMARKKETQPVAERSAGCVFRNPELDSAGRLIEAAGCKGMRVGGMEVSSLHANYIVNRGEGSSADFVKLMQAVRERVRERTGILLVPEVRVVDHES